MASRVILSYLIKGLGKETLSHHTSLSYVLKVFSTLLQRAENLNEISGIRVCRVAPKVSHLFFADDALIFSKTKDVGYKGILSIIQKYGSTSGQQINMEKSSMLFNPNVTQQV